MKERSTKESRLIHNMNELDKDITKDILKMYMRIKFQSHRLKSLRKAKAMLEDEIAGIVPKPPRQRPKKEEE